MASDGIKMEEDVKIKLDPEMGEASPFADDDDQYEDAGELLLPKDSPKIWLARIPTWLWQTFANASEEEQKQIGEMCVHHIPGGDEKLVFKLDDAWAKRRRVPQLYHMRVTKMEPENTWVFSEKNLPGYRPGNKVKSEASQQENRSGGGYRVDKRRRRFRPIIPKQTSLVGPKLDHEVECRPVQNKEYKDFMDEHNKVVIRSNTKMEILSDQEAQKGMGNVSNAANFQTFTTKDLPAQRKTGQENKASRIERAALIDLLFKLFQEYPNWRLRDLKMRTRQPEVYLKEVLSTIAVLVTSGDTSGTWRLKPENMSDIYDNLDMDAIAPEIKGETDDEMRDDTGDDNDEMEDVL